MALSHHTGAQPAPDSGSFERRVGGVMELWAPTARPEQTAAIPELIEAATAKARGLVNDPATLKTVLASIDHTTLEVNDSAPFVMEFARRAAALARSVPDAKVGALCVYGALSAAAREGLGDSGIPVAAVAAGFPTGHEILASKIASIQGAIALGAREIDIVLPRWRFPLDARGFAAELLQMKDACVQGATCEDPGAVVPLKIILATSTYLEADGKTFAPELLRRAAQLAVLVEPAYLKGNTGAALFPKATSLMDVSSLVADAIVLQEIAAHAAATGHPPVSYKFAGGMSMPFDAIVRGILFETIVGKPFAQYVRFGASGLTAKTVEALAAVDNDVAAVLAGAPDLLQLVPDRIALAGAQPEATARAGRIQFALT